MNRKNYTTPDLKVVDAAPCSIIAQSRYNNPEDYGPEQHHGHGEHHSDGHHHGGSDWEDYHHGECGHPHG